MLFLWGNPSLIVPIECTSTRRHRRFRVDLDASRSCRWPRMHHKLARGFFLHFFFTKSDLSLWRCLCFNRPIFLAGNSSFVSSVSSPFVATERSSPKLHFLHTTTSYQHFSEIMASLGDDDEQNQECKCYRVLSVKPITDKNQVFDMIATFLQNDRQRQLSSIDEDQVRTKASWNELRRWANSLLTESDGAEDNGNTKKRKPIEDWVDERDYFEEQDYDEEFEEEKRRISEGIVKMESAEATSRSEVAIAGRSAHESFIDHVSDNNGTSDAEQEQQVETKEERRARKKAKKEAKKAKKEAKKKAKKEKKSSKKFKMEE